MMLVRGKRSFFLVAPRALCGVVVVDADVFAELIMLALTRAASLSICDGSEVQTVCSPTLLEKVVVGLDRIGRAKTLGLTTRAACLASEDSWTTEGDCCSPANMLGLAFGAPKMLFVTTERCDRSCLLGVVAG